MFFFFFTPPFREREEGEKGGKGEEGGEGYAATDYSSVQDRQKTRYRGREARQKISFFVSFSAFLNYSTIKRTKSHQFSFSTMYTALKSSKKRKRKIKNYEGGDFFFLRWALRITRWNL